MRGARAKALRSRAACFKGFDAAVIGAIYAPIPRTQRDKTFMVPTVNAEGKTKMASVVIRTATFRLTPACQRFYTQRLKRYFVRNHGL